MDKITLYLDMDGVLTNFEKAYRAMWHEFTFDRERFREAVMERKIFRELEWMPNGEMFIEGIRKLEKDYNLNVEMLTSTGTHRTDMKAEGIVQKTAWLKEHGIIWKPNFVCSKPEKSQYAVEGKTILIDDHEGCTKPFIEKGGIAFLHKDSDYRLTLDKLDWCLDELTREIV
jgi:hypothetical protein